MEKEIRSKITFDQYMTYGRDAIKQYIAFVLEVPGIHITIEQYCDCGAENATAFRNFVLTGE